MFSKLERIVPPDSGRFGLLCNSSSQGPWAPSRPIGTRRPFFRLVKTIDPHYLGVVDYVTGRWCPTSAGLKPPLSPPPRPVVPFHPALPCSGYIFSIPRDAKTRVTSSRSRVVPVDMATRCARDLPPSSPLSVHPVAPLTRHRRVYH